MLYWSMASQYNISRQGLVAEYNSNNAWLYNGDNGRLNNNNKQNSNTVRPVLDFNLTEKGNLESFVIPLSAWYDIYRKCKRNKTSKPSHLSFLFNFSNSLVLLCVEVGNFEYVPRVAICFMITIPRLREVIAADFADRLVQTFYVSVMMPILEAKYLHPDSFACRKGKGGLKAVLKMQEYIFEESSGFTTDLWLAKVDIKGFFMAIDTDLAVRRLYKLIEENIPDPELRNVMMYLTRIIYQSMPQLHCIVKSPEFMFDALPEHKKMRGKETGIGVAIGNVTSQMVAMFLINFYLLLLQSLGYKFVHYTDDTCVCVKDKEKWLRDLQIIVPYVRTELHLELHPDKRYLQHYSKGVLFLGYKLRFNRVLPSDRIVHNLDWKVTCYIRRAEDNSAYMLNEAEHFMQVLNSYNGLLMWCNAYRLRSSVAERVKQSCWNKVFDFHDDFHVTIKPTCTKLAYYERLNKERKSKQDLSWLK